MPRKLNHEIHERKEFKYSDQPKPKPPRHARLGTWLFGSLGISTAGCSSDPLNGEFSGTTTGFCSFRVVRRISNSVGTLTSFHSLASSSRNTIRRLCNLRFCRYKNQANAGNTSNASASPCHQVPRNPAARVTRPARVQNATLACNDHRPRRRQRNNSPPREWSSAAVINCTVLQRLP